MYDRKNPKDIHAEELFKELMDVSSYTECTGLIPNVPEDDSQMESYAEIYDIPLSDVENKGKEKNKGK